MRESELQAFTRMVARLPSEDLEAVSTAIFNELRRRAGLLSMTRKGGCFDG